MELRITEVVATTGATRCTKLQSNRHHQHPAFYRPGALPVAQPYQSTEGKKYHIPWTWLHQTRLGSSDVVFDQKRCLVALGRVAKLLVSPRRQCPRWDVTKRPNLMSLIPLFKGSDVLAKGPKYQGRTYTGAQEQILARCPSCRHQWLIRVPVELNPGLLGASPSRHLNHSVTAAA